MNTNPRILVQSLKGSKAQILWAFLFAGAALDVESVCEWTGLKRATCYTPLNSLVAVGILGKQTVAHGREVYIMADEMLPLLAEMRARLTGNSESPIIDVPAGQESEFNTPKAQESVKRTPVPLTSIIIESKNLQNFEDSVIITNTRQVSAKRTPVKGKVISTKILILAPEVIAERIKFLNERGIFASKAQEIAEDHNIEMDAVDPHIAFAKHEEWEKPVGMAIYRLLAHAPAPFMDEAGRFPNDCQCSDCNSVKDFPRYSSSAFGDFDHEAVEAGCIWQDETDEVFGKNHPLAGQHKKTNRCGAPCADGSHKWCPDHLDQGQETEREFQNE